MIDKQDETTMQYIKVSRRAVLKSLGLTTLMGPVLSIQACSKELGHTAMTLYLAVENGSLNFILPRSEMGQDITTSFAMAIAEELEAPLDIINVRLADASTQIPNQMTVGSASIRLWWKGMRQIGANTKALLIKQAAIQNKRPESDFYAENGYIISSDLSLKIAYHELTHQISLPTKIDNSPLKDARDFNIIGTSQKSLFNKDKSTGNCNYLCDKETPESALRITSVAYKKDWPTPTQGRLDSIKTQYELSYAFGVESRVGSFDYWVFLCHKKTWPALQAKQALEQEKLDSLEKSPKPRTSAFESEREAISNLVNAQQVSITFETPAIAHAAMETPCASILLTSDKAEVWAPTQAPERAKAALAKRLNIDPSQIVLHTIPMGGAFGRKRYSDYLEELALAAQYLYQQKVSRQLTLMWTREDDLSREFYRPATLQHVQWQKLTPTELRLGVFEGYAGATNTQALPISTDLPLNLEIEAHKAAREHHFSSGIWRAVHHGYHAFALCSAVDEICKIDNIDPIRFYSEHPKTSPLKSRLKNYISSRENLSNRLLKVVEKVKTQASWKQNIDSNAGLGFAAYSVFDSHIALIAKVSLADDHQLKIAQVWAAVDCGLALNPDKLKAQIEGGILYGLSACLYGDVPTNKDQTTLNFDVSPVLRMTDSPHITIEIISSKEAPTGAGELGVPVIAPAVCNAIRSLSSYRFTKLPLIKNSKLNFDNAFEVLDT